MNKPCLESPEVYPECMLPDPAKYKGSDAIELVVVLDQGEPLPSPVGPRYERRLYYKHRRDIGYFDFLDGPRIVHSIYGWAEQPPWTLG